MNEIFWLWIQFLEPWPEAWSTVAPLLGEGQFQSWPPRWIQAVWILICFEDGFDPLGRIPAERERDPDDWLDYFWMASLIACVPHDP